MLLSSPAYISAPDTHFSGRALCELESVRNRARPSREVAAHGYGASDRNQQCSGDEWRNVRNRQRGFVHGAQTVELGERPYQCEKLRGDSDLGQPLRRQPH